LSRRRRFAAASALFALVASCGDSTVAPADPGGSDPATTTYAASLGVNIAAMTKLSNALYIQDLVAGTGAAAAKGHGITVTYTGWLVNGTQFDSNVGKTPLTFTLGVGQVIQGWDQGVVGMKLGGTRRLVIGSALAYGTQGRPPAIPSNSTLVFTVTLDSLQDLP
jgi:FKBP-type peptidyl-prolyl cis-trans isomerase FkpA